MLEIEKRLKENRKVSQARHIKESSLYKVGDRVKVATDTEEFVEVAEILGIEEVGIYRVLIDGEEYVLEELFLRPIDTSLTNEEDITPDEEEKETIMRPVHTPVSTSSTPIYENEGHYKVYYTRDTLEYSDDTDVTGTVIVYGAKDEDDAIQKAMDEVNDSEIQDLNPRNFRIAHKLGDKESVEETFDDKVVEGKKLKEYEVVGHLADDEISGRYIDLRDDLRGRNWKDITLLVDEIESRGFLVVTFNDDFVLVTDLEDQTPNPAEHVIPIKNSRYGGIVVRD